MTQPVKLLPVDEVTDELAKVRAAREALERARQAREEADEPKRRLAAEKLALENEQAIEDAESREGPVGRMLAVVNTDLGVVILKRPHAAVFRRFQDRGKTDHKYLYELVKPSLVHPTLDQFETICDQLPATMLRCADAVSKLAGVRAEDISAKQ